MVVVGKALKLGVRLQILPIITFVTQAILFNHQCLICKNGGDEVAVVNPNVPPSSKIVHW